MAQKNTIVLLIILGTVLIYLFTRPSTATPGTLIKIPDSVFNTGDIIFRDGRGAISAIFRNMSLENQSYSHAGIIHKELGQTFVYHIIGGEGKNSLMRKELLSDFCSIKEAYSFGVYRSTLNPVLIDSLAGKYYNERIRFDDKFDLGTEDKMYCTELVYNVLTKVSTIDNFLPLTTVRNMTYCSCDNIFLSPQLKKIYSYNYQ